MLLNFQAWFGGAGVLLGSRRASPGPASFQLPEISLESAETIRPRPAASRTILVVEDDRAIRSLFTHVLQGQGYEVIACEDGSLGLEAMKMHLQRIDAVITDSTMPGLDGRQLIEAIRRLRAEMPILVVSGSFDEGTASSDPARTVRLTKPISPTRLALELRRLLCDTMESLPDDDSGETR